MVGGKLSASDALESKTIADALVDELRRRR